MGRWAVDTGIKMTVVVEAIQPPALFEWFADLRRKFGMTVIPLGPSAGTQVLRALRNNEVVCLLSDRDLTGGGIPVQFFGETTTLPAGPATLALRTGAALLPTAAFLLIETLATTESSVLLWCVNAKVVYDLMSRVLRRTWLMNWRL